MPGHRVPGDCSSLCKEVLPQSPVSPSLKLPQSLYLHLYFIWNLNLYSSTNLPSTFAPRRTKHLLQPWPFSENLIPRRTLEQLLRPLSRSVTRLRCGDHNGGCNPLSSCLTMAHKILPTSVLQQRHMRLWKVQFKIFFTFCYTVAKKSNSFCLKKKLYLCLNTALNV